MKRSWIGFRMGVLAALVVAVAVFGAGVGQSRSNASILIDGTTDSVTNVDPAGNYDYGSGTVDILIYQHLLDFPAGKTTPAPSLATGCKANASVTVWTCLLKKGVKFSNGDPFTSTDVKWSFDRVNKIHDPSGIWSLISNLKNVTTSGPYKVIFHLSTAQSTWPYILTTGAGAIVDHKVYPAGKIVANTDLTNLVGTGPYKLSKFTPGQTVVLEPNPNYDGSLGAVKNDGLIINYYSKSSTMKLALQKGEIDMAFRDFTPTEYASLGKASGIKVWKGNGVAIRYLVLSVKRPPTNKLAVRKALAYLMPRQDIATRIYHNNVVPLYSMPPAGLGGHINAFGELYGKAPNVAKAKAVLRAAHVKTPVPLTIWWTPSHYGDASADEYSEIQRALNSSKLFRISLKSAEWATYSKTLGTQYNAFQLGWFPDYPDAEDYLTPFYGTKSNFTSNGYSSKRMDAILKKEEAAKTTSQRLTYIKQAQVLAAKDAPIIPVWQGAMIAVSKTNVSNIPKTLDLDYLMRFWLLSKS
jgi:peptide/nickel transport system substrate-binding protein